MSVRRSWARWLPGVIVLGSLCVLAWCRVASDRRVWTEAGAERHEADEPGPPTVTMPGGIRPRSIDPASPPLEWVRDGISLEPPRDASPLYLLTDDEESLEEFMGLLEWALSVGLGGRAELEVARCAARFEPELDHKCGWEIVAVLRRSGEDTGEIAYARADLTRGADQPACRALASCATEAWAGREEVPMPPSLGSELSFSQTGRGSSWDPSKRVEIESHYRRLVVEERRSLEGLEAAAQGPTSVTPSSLGWNMLFARHHLDEFECMLQVLEDREGACGT
ncbi:hypothetical protein [Paraliomyxa miuraensis]|uniref:hypothetical protein n=1 Tax=Paraliomyxa miuraensis TaxID=376150 RepID=UPI002250DDA3|nr:hypothetical protein [Paraliomyxa miuraensis]MCX4247678.1 hypothetical protein [Paraliomyxa miuraensis]